MLVYGMLAVLQCVRPGQFRIAPPWRSPEMEESAGSLLSGNNGGQSMSEVVQYSIQSRGYANNGLQRLGPSKEGDQSVS